MAQLLAKNAASCLCVSDKVLALGTHDGTVHVLDYSGNEVSGSVLIHFFYALGVSSSIFRLTALCTHTFRELLRWKSNTSVWANSEHYEQIDINMGTPLKRTTV